LNWLQVEEWAPKIESILEWFGQLQEVDISGVAPETRTTAADHPLRPDEPVVFPQREQMLGQAADKEGAFVKVPKTATAAD
jgi:aspartyl-tRNA(Asn)/glutamyl-tRNA(Gln) amidotransferase subunit C